MLRQYIATSHNTIETNSQIWLDFCAAEDNAKVKSVRQILNLGEALNHFSDSSLSKHLRDITYFKLNNKFYKQKSCHSMVNLLSRVLACLFLEILESGSFEFKLPSNTTYFRNIDVILIFLHQNIRIKEIAEKLNNVEPSINLTNEKKKSNNTITSSTS